MCLGKSMQRTMLGAHLSGHGRERKVDFDDVAEVNLVERHFLAWGPAPGRAQSFLGCPA